MNTKLTKLIKNSPDTVVTRRRAKRLLEAAVCLTFALALVVVPAFATGGGGDGGAALTAVNKLSDFSAPVNGR